jgi:Raf kinase inhibitor-like YbhB/YbcL family protein
MAQQGFSLTSPDFTNGQMIPRQFTGEGEERSPELKWLHAPEGTRSFALIVDDPDAPNGTFTHWVLFDIPAEAQFIPQGVPKMGVGGHNDFHHDHYGGPMPPPHHGVHRYYFKLYALDIESLNLKQGAKREEVEQAMEGHIIGQAELMGRYERPSAEFAESK